MEQWAEIRRMSEVEGLSQRKIARRSGLHRKTIRRALASDEPPSYSRPSKGSKLDPFKGEINRLLKADPKIPSQRMTETTTRSIHTWSAAASRSAPASGRSPPSVSTPARSAPAIAASSPAG